MTIAANVGEKFIRVSTTTPQGTQYGAVDPYAALALLLEHIRLRTS